MRNKLCSVSETLQEHNLDLLCITETWLLSCDVATVGASLPGSSSFLHVPRLTATKGGGVGLIYLKALSSVRMVGNQIEVSSFKIMEVSLSLCLQTFKMAIVYRPDHPGTGRTFMNEFSICSDRLLTFGIRSIRSPAKVGLVVTDLITSPVVSWRGWETPPPSTAAQLSFFAQPRPSSSASLCLRYGGWTGLFSWTSNLSILSFSISYVMRITITQGWGVESVVLSFRL